MRAALILLVALVLTGCSRTEEKTEDRILYADAAEEVEKEAQIIDRKAVTPYPAAVRVELHVQNGIRTPDGESGWFPSRTLTAEQRRAVEATLFSPVYGEGSRSYVGCFIPHHFFRYFDKTGRQIGEIAVCFCCGGAAAVPRVVGENAELEVDLKALEPIIKDLGFRTDIECH